MMAPERIGFALVLGLGLTGLNSVAIAIQLQRERMEIKAFF